MKLSTYLRTTGTGPGEFARAIGVTREAVRRYARGERLPRPDIMRRIYEVTGGLVGPADFLGIEDLRERTELERELGELQASIEAVRASLETGT